ncbi:MAG: hypothetical protein IPO68_16490 [Chitinophagaceae bacterium]|nr:hypothetical protein [Chitinophagaceae bacterium]
MVLTGTDPPLTQLVQSGNLRYFKNKELVRKINKYYSLQGQIESNNDADHLHRDRIIEIRDRLLAARYYEFLHQCQSQ